MAHRRSTDANQTEVTRALRLCGFDPLDLSNVGGGVPDLAVGIEIPTLDGDPFRFVVLMEVKDGEKAPSARKLTPDQESFFRTFRGAAVVISSAEEAVSVCRSIQRGAVRDVDRWRPIMPKVV